jgi:hypothetical protein
MKWHFGPAPALNVEHFLPIRFHGLGNFATITVPRFIGGDKKPQPEPGAGIVRDAEKHLSTEYPSLPSSAIGVVGRHDVSINSVRRRGAGEMTIEHPTDELGLEWDGLHRSGNGSGFAGASRLVE